MQLKQQQQQAFDKIVSFLKDEDSQIFILKGFAGTGKTTMIHALLEEINRLNKHSLLLAPTGRAAKVLREKTGYHTHTIHSMIYSKAHIVARRYDEEGNLIKEADNNTSANKGVDKVEYVFALKNVSDCVLNDGSKLTPQNTVIIVDESSLISSKAVKEEVFHFGTDVLLDDLLTFSRLHFGTKIIFVGDPAQLPPVGDNKSNALNEDFFIQKGLEVCSAELTDVLHQSGDGTILKNAMKIRSLLDEPLRNSLTFDYRDGEFEMISSADIIRRYYGAQPRPQIGENIIICYSNSQVKRYNDCIRQLYFPGCSGIQVGDVLQIVKNDYNHTPEPDNLKPIKESDMNLYNGDFVRVLNVSPTSECIPVIFWKSMAGKKTRIETSLKFRDVKFITTDDRIFSVKILETLLENDKPSLTPDQHIALYRFFRNKHKEIGNNPVEMNAALKSDPYINAVHVKYGYAITAHKSQGGEWANAYVDYTGRTGLSDDHLRWAYTATTRATSHLFVVNAPNITSFSRFLMYDIKTVSKASKGIVALADIDIDEEMSYMSNFRRWKYNCTKRRLNEIGLSIVSVSPLKYVDRYRISTPLGIETIDCGYTAADIYSRYTPITTATEYTPLILKILNDESDYRYNIEYAASFASLEALRQKVVSACDELEIPITNIQEFRDRYYVQYSFKTSGRFSFIQFYFNGNGSITNGIPSSDLGIHDKLLTLLIEKLSK